MVVPPISHPKLIIFRRIFSWLLGKPTMVGNPPYSPRIQSHPQSSSNRMMVVKTWWSLYVPTPWKPCSWCGVRCPHHWLFPIQRRNRINWRCLIWMVVKKNMFYFHPYLGKIPILTNIFGGGLVQPPTRPDGFGFVFQVSWSPFLSLDDSWPWKVTIGVGMFVFFAVRNIFCRPIL